MDILKFEQFIKVCECGNMTNAAKELYISQPSLSSAIASFEKFVGCRLFDREHKSIILNKSGEIALKYAYEVVGSISHMRSEINAANTQKSSLKILCDDELFIAPLVALFMLEYQHINIEIIRKSMQSPEDMLRNRSVDLVVSNAVSKDSDVNSIFLVRDFMYVLIPAEAGATQFSSVDSASLKDFADCNFIRGIKADFKISDELSKQIGKIGLKKIRYINTSFKRQMELKTKEFSFMSFLRYISCQEAVHASKAHLVKLTDPEITADYYLQYVYDDVPEIKTLLEWIAKSHSSLFAAKSAQFTTDYTPA